MAKGQLQGVGSITVWMIIFVALWLTSTVFLVILYTGQEDLNNELARLRTANDRLISGSAKFAANAIAAAAIADAAIDAATFAAGAINATAIADAAIDEATFAANAINWLAESPATVSFRIQTNSRSSRFLTARRGSTRP